MISQRRTLLSLGGCRPLLARTYHLTSSSANGVPIPGNNSVLLRSLPPSTTYKSLEAQLKDIKYRRLQFQPGCAIHFSNALEATVAATSLQSEKGLKITTSSISLPSVVVHGLQNEKVIQELIAQATTAPLNIEVHGAKEILVKVNCASEAFQISKEFATLAQSDASIKFGVSSTEDNSYLFKVVGASSPQELVSNLKTKFSKADASIAPAPSATHILRLDSDYNDLDAERIESLTMKLSAKNSPYKAQIVPLPKPAIFIRNVGDLSPETIEKLLKPYNPERVQLLKVTKDGYLKKVVVYFANENAARACYAVLKGSTIDGVKLAVHYREVSAPGVMVSNLPGDVTKEAVRELFQHFNVAKIKISTTESSAKAFVTLDSPETVELAMMALDGKTLENQVLAVDEHEIFDLGIKITEVSGPLPDLKSIAKLSGIEMKGYAVDTGISANLAFESLQQATELLKTVEKNHIQEQMQSGSYSGYGYYLSTLPSAAVEVDGLKDDSPVVDLLKTLHSVTPKVKPIRVDRSALIKLARRAEVPPAIKAIKAIELDGQLLKAEHYRPIVASPSSPYDSKVDEVRKASQKVLYDSEIEYNAGERYRIIRNRFERALVNAKGTEDVTALLDKYLPEAAHSEATQLLVTHGKDYNERMKIEERLFELYIQRDDLLYLTADFPALIATHGPPDASDPYNWAYAKIEDEEDIEKYKKLSSSKSNNERQEQEAKIPVQRVEDLDDEIDEAKGDAEREGEDDDERDDEDEDEDLESVDEEESVDEVDDDAELSNRDMIVLKGEGEDEEDIKISLADTANLTDEAGHVWSGAILDADAVQKTMPGQRINTSRALVVVGNLRGTAGFGMGKGKTGFDAINAAFRAALRNLIHVDLYDNFGFAKDLFGKHNSCRCYIRATPKSREMVASSVATDVLTRLGVSSASVKLTGRRNPYSMVRAIFNALEQHQNIDEYAKARGKRYLTIKWAKGQNM